MISKPIRLSAALVKMVLNLMRFVCILQCRIFIFHNIHLFVYLFRIFKKQVYGQTKLALWFLQWLSGTTESFIRLSMNFVKNEIEEIGNLETCKLGNLQTGNWKLEAGNLTLETANRKPDIGKLETEIWKLDKHMKHVKQT